KGRRGPGTDRAGRSPQQSLVRNKGNDLSASKLLSVSVASSGLIIVRESQVQRYRFLPLLKISGGAWANPIVRCNNVQASPNSKGKTCGSCENEDSPA